MWNTRWEIVLVLGLVACLLLAITLIVIYDVKAIKENKETLSQRIHEFSAEVLIAVFGTGILVGVLAGHLYWPLK